MSDSNKPLKMVTCPGCDKKTFIPGDLPPLATEQCRNCGHAIMMPMMLRQFELRAKVGSGGMATKLMAARIAQHAGCATLITLGARPSPSADAGLQANR